ncbi:MAG: hypothetical protein H0X64_00020 [Gemmatimonadaceae bacterium]|nr:hypothetical protein [Gemmatimonadaceae bacterium]
MSSPPPSRRAAAATTFATNAANIGLGALQSIILLPYFIRYLGKGLYGSWLSSGDVLAWIQAVDLGLPGILTQRIGAAHGRGDEVDIGRWLFSGVISLGAVAAFVVWASYAVAPRLPQWFKVPAEQAASFELTFQIAAIATAGIIMQYVAVGFARGTQRTAFMGLLMALSSPVGFVVTLVMLLHGFGLPSIAWGMLARSTVLIVGSAYFLFSSMTPAMFRGFRFDAAVMRETSRLMPVTALGGLSYAAMNQSEFAIIGFMLDPALATGYLATRRASDVGRAVADAIAYGTYGSFAHLVTSEQRANSIAVYNEVVSIRTSFAVALAGAYIAMNASFVAAWVGPGLYGGTQLTLLLALSSVVGGGAFLTNYLYRATGAVAEGSIASAVEAVVRIGLMVWLVSVIGVPGIPLASLVTASVFGVLAYRWSISRLRPFATEDDRVDVRVWAARISFLVLAVAVGHSVRIADWIAAAMIGGTFGAVGLVGLVAIDTRAGAIRTMAANLVRKARTPW